MLNVIQWSGSLLICVGFYFMVTRPRVSPWFTMAGCALLIAWAGLLSPAAWGIIFLQSVVSMLSIRNLFKSRNVTSKPQ